MRDLLITLLVLGAIPMILMRPHIGILVWSWLGYMNPHRFTYGFAYSMPFSAMIAVVLFLGMLFSKEKKSFPWNRITIMWAVLVFWILVPSTIFAINSADAMVEFERFIKIQILIACTLMLINTKERLIQLIWVIVVSIGFFGVKGGVFALVTGFNYKISGARDSFLAENNATALAILMVIPLMYFLFTIAEKRYVRWALLGAILLSLFAVVASYSRGAFLAMLIMLFFLWLGTKHKLVLIASIVSIVLVGMPFIPEKWYERMNTIETYQEDESAMGRINAWYFAANLANDSPMVGGGLRAFSPELFVKYAPDPLAYADAHSIYFEMLGETGYVGLTLFLLMWGLVFLETHKIKKLVKRNDDVKWMGDLVRMVQVGLIAYLTGGAFLGLAYFDLPYHFMCLIVLTGVLYRKHLEAEVGKSEKNNISYPR